MIPIWLSFVLGFIIYTFAAFLSNSPTLKASSLYYILGIGIGAVANFIWFTIAKQIADHNKILTYGMYWDTIIILSFMFVPLAFYGARPNVITSIGLGFMFFGFLLTKVGG